MIVFALGCLAGITGTLAAICLGERRPDLALAFGSNAFVAAAAGITLAIWGVP